MIVQRLRKDGLAMPVQWPKRHRHFKRSKPTSQSSYLLPQDQVVDNNSFEAHVENLAMLALKRYDTDLSGFELVKTGPLGFGTYWAGFILHLNFEARNYEPDAEVQTFFSELTMKNNNVVTVSRVFCLGQSKALPEIADDRSCVYCCSQNIHHPECFDSFRNGRADRWIFLSSQVNKPSDYLPDGLIEYEEFSPLMVRPGLQDKEFTHLFTHLGLHYFIKFSRNLGPDLRYAHEALLMYNAKEGKNMEVLDKGSASAAVMSFGCLCHLNFEAKNIDDPGAPKQTFFAEVIRGNNFIFVDYCECLGSSDSLPDKADLRGCGYCAPTTHHPPGSRYLTGREHLVCDMIDFD